MRPMMIVVLALVSISCGSAAQDGAAQATPPDVIAMERAALDRWGKGDPQGYLEMMANEITYFDPTQEKRVDGRQALAKILEPLTGKIKVARFDMIDPKVQHHGDAALLTFNIVSYVTGPDGKELAVARWNSSELYGRVDGQWRIVHSHWSYIKPELKQPVTEISASQP
jgi:ketosteroid isomerase-like protein